MIPLSLSKLAWIVGAKPKWVLNAARRLSQPLDYSESQARWLRLVRALNHELRIPLPLAAQLASRALEARPRHRTVRLLDAPAHGLRLSVDLNRYASGFSAALAASHVFATGKRAGRKQPIPRRPGSAIVRARRRGIEVWRLRAESRRPPAHHLSEIRSRELLKHLLAARVRLVLAGAAAESVHGAGAADGRLEICYATSIANMKRLARALRDLNARWRFDSLPDRVGGMLETGGRERASATGLSASLLSTDGLAIATDHGPLDLRSQLPGVGGYAEALGKSNTIDGLGLRVPVLTLPTLVAARRTSGTRADREIVPVLEALHAIPMWAAPLVLRKS